MHKTSLTWIPLEDANSLCTILSDQLQSPWHDWLRLLHILVVKVVQVVRCQTIPMHSNVSFGKFIFSSHFEPTWYQNNQLFEMKTHHISCPFSFSLGFWFSLLALKIPIVFVDGNAYCSKCSYNDGHDDEIEWWWRWTMYEMQMELMWWNEILLQRMIMEVELRCWAMKFDQWALEVGWWNNGIVT